MDEIGVLLFEMPSGCSKCDFREDIGEGSKEISVCVTGDRVDKNSLVRAKCCPVRTMPKKYTDVDFENTDSFLKSIRAKEYCDGWNACIDEIIKQ